jgi:Tol biopolymer transport system component
MRVARRVFNVGVMILLCVGVVAPPARATFPGDNGLLVWSRPTSFVTDAELFVMRPDGRHFHQLTFNDQNDFFPAWSPDGRWIAFESSTATDLDVWIIRADGAAARNLTNDPGRADRYPAWSPDGRQIAFARQSPFNGYGGIFVIDSDGSNMRRLTTDAHRDSQPVWSPNGQWIAFSSERDGNLDLWAIHPDGTGLRRLTNTPTRHEENPNWSPDGTMLAFDACEADSFPCPGSPNYDVFTMTLGGVATRITTDPSIDANPSWSPDGTKMAFRSDRTGFTQIWKMNPDGSNQVQLTFEDFQGGVDPDWQPRRP